MNRKNDVWYGAGRCAYWTDRWHKLKSGGGIPCCPICGAVGFEADKKEWLEAAKAFEKDGNPGYVDYLLKNKEVCHTNKKSFIEGFNDTTRHASA